MHLYPADDVAKPFDANYPIARPHGQRRCGTLEQTLSAVGDRGLQTLSDIG